MKKGKFIFLGTGASTGIPVVGCSCSTCHSPLPLNKRLRPSGLIQIENSNIFLDVGPDFRQQVLLHNIDRITGILLTHSHFDHIGGLDDLRPFSFLQQQKIPCLVAMQTFEELKIRYHYLIHPHSDGRTHCAQIGFHLLEKEFGVVNFLGVDWRVFSYLQGHSKVIGYRLGTLAYVSDIRDYTSDVIEAVKGSDVLIVSALRHESSPMHFSLDEAIAFARKAGASRTFLTHISHDLEHEKTSCELPPDVQLGYDGLEIDFEY